MKKNSKNHILIIGGTGMLAEVVRYFSSQYKTTSVIARHKGGLLRLQEQVKNAQSHFKPIAVDYRDYRILEKKINSATLEFGNIDIIISWIHSSAPDALQRICQAGYCESKKLHLFEILSSSFGKITEYHKIQSEKYSNFKNLHYHSILLGEIKIGNSTRWLNNREISEGVIQAVENESVTTVVGSNLNNK